MNVVLHRRAEIALRSLERAERNRISRELDALETLGPADLRQSGKLWKLATPSGEDLYSYTGSPQLSLVLSIEANAYVVQDVVARDRLNQLFSREQHEETAAPTV